MTIHRAGLVGALVVAGLVAICGATGGGIGAWVVVVGLVMWSRRAARRRDTGP